MKPGQKLVQFKTLLEKVMLLNKFPGDVHIRFNTNFKQIYKLIHDFVIERATAKYENSEANQEEELPIHNALVDYM